MTRLIVDRVLRMAGIVLYLLRLHGFVIWLRRGTPRVLLYHACQPEEDDAIRGLKSNTPPALLARQLDFLVRHYRVIPLSALESGAFPSGAVVITFDDGYRSVYDHAFPLLTAKQLPAVVYLVTDVVGTNRLIWVNELNWLLRRHASIAHPLAVAALGCRGEFSPEAIINRAVRDYDPARITALLAAIRAQLPADAEPAPRLYLSWDEIRTMRDAGITFGNHTASHPNLARLGPAAQQVEMAAGLARIAEMLEPPTSLAYPFGMYDATSAAAAVATGHRSVMLAGGGSHPRDRLLIDRTSVRSSSDAELFAELEIVAPAHARLKRLLGRGLPRAA